MIAVYLGENLQLICVSGVHALLYSDSPLEPVHVAFRPLPPMSHRRDVRNVALCLCGQVFTQERRAHRLVWLRACVIGGREERK